ncbi:MAG TPA: aminopeptidase P family protein [Bacteroidia bacterium]|nr:aminopeptidase P family protein [Bacteroidia bacterium]
MRCNLSVFLLFFSLIPGLSSAQSADADLMPATFFEGRRAAFRNLMPDSSLAVIFANPIRNRSNDVDYQYSQDPNFYYLTGFRDPDAVLLMFKEPRNFDGELTNTVIFVRPKDAKRETWTGIRPDLNQVSKITSITKVYATSDFNDFGFNANSLKEILVHYPDQPNKEPMSKIALANLVDDFNAKVNSVKDRIDKSKANRLLATLREVKQPEELLLLKKAIAITADGFTEMLKAMKPGMTEYQAQAIVEYFVKNNGGEYQGYPSICGAARNSCVLHYEANRKVVNDGEVLLTDIGGEYHGYTADITRTFPINGKFTAEQKQIYQIVLDAQTAGIKVCRAGADFRATHKATMEVVTEGLLKLGIISSKDDASTYFMHGTSHYLGLDVHDAGTYGPLKVGSVITVEPGIYIPAGAKCDPKWWNIGVRIEDDILITDGDPVNLSGNIPREAEAVEKLMAKDSFLNR